MRRIVTICRFAGVLAAFVWLVCGALLPAQEKPTAYAASLLEVELEEPAYRQSIYSTQSVKRIVVRLAKKAELTGDSPVQVALVGPDSGTIISGRMAKKGDKAIFDASSLPPGDYTVKCVAANEWGVKAEQVIPVKVLPPAKIEVYFDGEGICYANGKAIFPLGLYHVDFFLDMVNEDRLRAGKPAVSVEQMYRTVAAEKFNYIVNCTPETRDDARNQLVMGLQAKHGLWEIRGADYASPVFDEHVTKFREQPKLFAWYTLDEPYNEHMFNEGTKRYALIKELDPYHPVLIAQCYSDLYRLTGTIADVVAQDSYPMNGNKWWVSMPWWKEEWTSPLRLSSKYGEMIKATQGPRRPAWVIVQAFGIADYLMPSEKDLRSMTYQSVIAGARGLGFYAYASGEKDERGNRWWIEDYPALWKALGRLVAELRGLEPVLVAPGGEYSLTCTGAPDIRYMKRKRGNDLYVFAANIGEKPQTLLADGLKGKRVELISGMGRPKLVSGSLRETLEPFGVRVYRIR